MICKTCGMDLPKKEYTTWLWKGVRKPVPHCSLCASLLKLHLKDVSIQASRLTRKQHCIGFVHEWDFHIMKDVWNIPMEREEFFREHPDGKIEIAVDDYLGDVFVQGSYV